MNLNIRKYIYLTLTILTICFIFYNSTRNGVSSSNTSNLVTEFVNNLMAILFKNFTISSYSIRKIAHFTEFFLLGVFLTFTFEGFNNKATKSLGYILFFALFIPVLDETIQLFSIGRSSQVSDVLIDFSGALTGITYAFIFLWFKYKFLRKYTRHNF